MRKLLLLLCLAAGLSLGCQKTHPPSPEYQKARLLWLDLLKEKMDKAYVDPQAQEVLALLSRVDPNSFDAEYAARLKAEIEKGRSEAASDRARLDKQLEQATAAARPSFMGMPTSSPKGDGGVVFASDGGGPNVPVPGMAASEFEERFGGCFESRGDATVGGLAARIWGLRDLSKCRDQFPGFVVNVVMIVNNRVESIRSQAEVAPKKFKLVDGKMVEVSAAEAAAMQAPPPEPPPEPVRRPATAPGMESNLAPVQVDPGAGPPSTLPMTQDPENTSPTTPTP
jgi:hypothetical protein